MSHFVTGKKADTWMCLPLKETMMTEALIIRKGFNRILIHPLE